MLLLLFLNYWLIFLIPVVIPQISNPVAKLIVPIGITTKEANAEMEAHLVIAEIAVSKRSILFENL